MELQVIQSKIYEIRGRKVMLDRDLAELYGVETRALNQTVKRNIERFEGDDFMFVLSSDEIKDCSRSQFVILNNGRGHNIKYAPFAFTELGVAMLSSVLKSNVAIQINRSIMRAFVTLRQYALGYAELNRKLEDFMLSTNMQFSEIYQALT
ncbi:MAG: ORF6N domain-containing protein, partial [Prevotellaceae bacterium]|nr:ORF6N domain-containing protein [Prevotellaceae bacterium]